MSNYRKKFETKTAFKKRLKKKEINVYRYVIITIFIGIVYWLFFELTSIGGDYRYDLFVFWIPVVVGIIITIKFDLLLLDYKDLLKGFKEEKYIFLKIVYFPFLLLIHFIFSVIIFWIPVNIIWDSFNRVEISKNKAETYEFQIAKFQLSRSRDAVYFYFKDQLESIPVSYNDIKPYLGENPTNYKLELKIRKGIWNYYTVDSFHIIEKEIKE